MLVHRLNIVTIIMRHRSRKLRRRRIGRISYKKMVWWAEGLLEGGGRNYFLLHVLSKYLCEPLAGDRVLV